MEYVDAEFRNSDGLRVRYRRWGLGGEALICLHGLLRTRRDFDAVGAALGERYTVVAPDFIGRGESQWPQDPSLYDNSVYARDVLALAAHLDLDRYALLGTSMGGLVALALAGQPESPVTRLVLNDVGPELRVAVLRDIAERIRSSPQRFSDFEAGLAFIKEAYADYGELPEAQWRKLAQDSLVAEGDGGYRLHYDPRIIEAYRMPEQDIDLWPLFRQAQVPKLVLRGERSQVLTADCAERLRGEPDTRVVEIPGVGHAPALVRAAELDALERFL